MSVSEANLPIRIIFLSMAHDIIESIEAEIDRIPERLELLISSCELIIKQKRAEN